MALLRLRIPLFPALPDVVHHLVLPLPRNVRPREHHVGAVLPERVGLLLVLDPPAHGDAQLQHEVGAGGDAVAVELLPVGEDAVPGEERGGELLGLLGGAESTGALLIHLGAGGDAVHGEVQDAAGADYAVQSVDVAENLLEHLGLVQHNEFLPIAVGARMNDPVHVQIEIIDGDVGRQSLRQSTVDRGILIGQPAEHFGYAAQGGRTALGGDGTAGAGTAGAEW
mmetsp:Transcript_6834/g.20360  ORF Transcript_6834/g.20360 Transcript_6834/m.20360 type:complete len:225 (-) Transcript_6834:1390-2064(-)